MISGLFFFQKVLNTYSIDSEKLQFRFGKIYSFDIKRQIMGMRGNEASQAIIDKLQLDISLADFMAEIEAVSEMSVRFYRLI